MRRARGEVARRALVALVALAPGVRAGEPAASGAAGADPDVVARAQREFEQAKEHVHAGRWSEGCRLFESSFALFPSVATQLKVGRCREHEGRLVDALAVYDDAMRRNVLSGTPERQEELRAWTDDARRALLLRVAWLRIDAAPGVAPGELACDGVPLDRADLGRPRMVDPGAHAVVARPLGLAEHRVIVTLGDGERRDVLVRPPPPPAPAAAPAPRPVASTGSHVAVVGLAAAGLAGLATGTWLALRAAGEAHDAAPYCRGDACLPPGAERRDAATRDQRVAAGAFGVGVVASAAAGWLAWRPGRREAAREVGVSVSTAAVTVRATF